MEYPIGTIGLSRIRGPVGLAVKVMQWISGDGSPWTHAFVVTGPNEVIEAAPGGIIYRPLTDYLGRAAFLTDWTDRLTEEQQGRLVGYAARLKGAQYGWLQYPALGLLAVHVKPELLRSYISRSDRYICSQLADELHRYVGSQFFDDGRESMDVTPGDLAREYTLVTGRSPQCN